MKIILEKNDGGVPVRLLGTEKPIEAYKKKGYFGKSSGKR